MKGKYNYRVPQRYRSWIWALYVHTMNSLKTAKGRQRLLWYLEGKLGTLDEHDASQETL